jgi:hypothetical protein
MTGRRPRQHRKESPETSCGDAASRRLLITRRFTTAGEVSVSESWHKKQEERALYA